MTTEALIRPDGWLSGVMARAAFAVDVPSRDASLRELARHARAHRGAFYTAKLPVDRVADVRALCEIGFAVVDTGVTFERPMGSVTATLRDVPITLADDESGEQAALVAMRSFQWSRFHLDPRIPRETADRIKGEWVRSYVRKSRGDALLVASAGGSVVGFVAALVADGSAVIDLIAVDPSHQGAGIGRALIARHIDAYASTVARYRVGTQAANSASVRLYESLGYRLHGATYALHLHA
ncbi:MAG: GNAT family N-acetyltransferase [Chloroflexi bacterium]|nr:GNAT family N-acetyltransferase [Chloroflexota bacterium]